MSSTNNTMNNQKNICAFCGRNNLQVEKIVAGKESSICNECIMIALEAIQKERAEAFTDDNITEITPQNLKKEFDKYVIGQDDAKKYLSVVVSNHYKRLLNQDEPSINNDKVNLLMIGPTSSGKTLLLKVLQNFLKDKNIPVAFADATTLTEAGYVGDDVESMLLRLLQEADFNIIKAEKGIIFIDEIDKIAQKQNNGLTKDISGEGVQHALLGILQGKVASVNIGKKNIGNNDHLLIDTTNILFICAGAFSGLEEIISNRIHTNQIGFHSPINPIKKEKSYKKFEVEDLIAYGFIPEFTGRLSSIVTLNELSKEQLMEILTKPENAITLQYQKLAKLYNADLIFEQDAIEKIAEIAQKKHVSSRGLRTIIEEMLTDMFFNLDSSKKSTVRITAQNVINKKVEIEQTKKVKSKMIKSN